MACIHGNDPRTCIVCKTLREVDTLSGKPAGGRRAPSSAPVDIVGRPDRTPASGGGHHVGYHLAVFAAVLVAAAISIWFLAGAVYALFRLIEVLVVALLAGTLGYRIGRARGRHERR